MFEQKKDFIAGCIVIFIACLFYWGSIAIPTLGKVDPIGPQIFPKIISYSIGITGLLLALKSLFLSSGKAKQESYQSTDELEALPWSKSTLRAAAMILLPALYLLLLYYLGYLLSMFLLTVALLLILKEKKWSKIITMSILLPLILYSLFHFGFKVMLPTAKIF